MADLQPADRSWGHPDDRVAVIATLEGLSRHLGTLAKVRDDTDRLAASVMGLAELQRDLLDSHRQLVESQRELLRRLEILLEAAEWRAGMREPAGAVGVVTAADSEDRGLAPIAQLRSAPDVEEHSDAPEPDPPAQDVVPLNRVVARWPW